MLTLYNVISQDGFIARKGGSEDFIPDDTWQYFLDLCNRYGALIIGRKTYETIKKYDKHLLDSFESLPIKKIIVTRDRDFNADSRFGYIIMHSPEEAVNFAPNALVSSGATLNNYLLENNFVKEIIQKKIPVSIGEGIRPYDVDKAKSITVVNI